MLLIIVGILAKAVTAAAQVLSCSSDNCLTAVAIAQTTASTKRNGTADCASFLRGTITPAARTELKTVTITVVATLTKNTTPTVATIQTVATDAAALLERRSRHEPWKVWASERNAVKSLQKRQSTSKMPEFPTKTPAYASHCSSLEAYRSACSCVGVNSTVVTASTPTETSTVVVTAFGTQTKVFSHFVNATRFANSTATGVSNNTATKGTVKLAGLTANFSSQTMAGTTPEPSAASFATGPSRANGSIATSINKKQLASSESANAITAKDSSHVISAVLPSRSGSSKAPHQVQDAVPTAKAAAAPFPLHNNSTRSGAFNSTLGGSTTNNTGNGTLPASMRFGSFPTGARFGSNSSTALNMTRFDLNATRAMANATSVRAPFAFLNATGTSTAHFSNTTDPARWRNNTIPRFSNTSTSTTATIDKTCGETSTPFAIKVSQDGGNINGWFVRLSGKSLIFTSEASRASRFAVGGSGRLCAVGAKGPLDNAMVAVVENKTDMATSPLWFVDGGLVANLGSRGYAEPNCSSGEGTVSCAYSDISNWLGCGLQLGLSSNDGGDFEGIKCQAVKLMTKEPCGAGSSKGNSTITRFAVTKSTEAAVATALPIIVGLPTTFCPDQVERN